jgi:hypothetical protein
MIDVTALVRQWILCSNDLWSRWFASTERGASEFLGIELALLDAMVLERGDLSCKGLSIENFFEKLHVIYPTSINHQVKQLCLAQRTGNIFCKPHTVSVSAGDKFRVKSIDTMGTMQGGRPYVEVQFGDGYILESPDSVDFFVE